MIIFYDGKPRTGKTLGMVFAGYWDFRAGRKIFSNVPLKFDHVFLKHPSEILDYAFVKFERVPKTFLIQECDKWFDARTSWRQENRMLSGFVGQSGKRNIDVYYDSQFATRIEKALEDVTDYKVYCEVIRDENKEPLMFRQYWKDIFYPHKSFWKTYPAFIMEEFYKLYDTYYRTEQIYETRRKK